MTPDDLIAWRKTLGLSQADAALKLGAGRRSIQQWESGQYDIPRYIALACSAIALNVPPYGEKHAEAADALERA